MKKILMVLAIGAIMTGCNSKKIVPNKELTNKQIGWYKTIEEESWINGEKQSEGVYLVMTPRGLEEVYSQDRLKESLDVYINWNVYGKNPEEYNFSDSTKKKFRIK